MTDAAEEHRAAPTPAAPLLSVIIPTYARPAVLGGCLESLANQSISRERFEVVVVDDGSPEPLDAAIAPFVDRLDVRLLPQANSGPCVARNTGVAAARGRYLAFTDDDCRPTPEWLETLDRHLHSTPDRLIGGRTTNGLESNAFSTASQVIVEIAYAFYNPTPETATFFASNNLARAAALRLRPRRASLPPRPRGERLWAVA
jgi:glycosyltransferase involved in cell wall biosynthesis